MGCSILRLKGITKLVHKYCSGGPLRMMSSTPCPWLMLPPEVDVDGGAAYYKFYSLASSKVARLKKEASSAPALPSSDGEVRVVGSSHGWLATFNHENDHIILSDPISTHHMKLPDIHTLPRSPCGSFTTVGKIVLTAAAECPRAVTVMTFHAHGMAVCCPGGSNSKWTWFGDFFYKDLVYSSRRKRLFCITRDSSDGSHVESWDLSDPNSPTRDWSLQLDLELDDEDTKSVDEADLMGAEFSRRDRYLVFAEQSDQLFMVTRHILEHADRDGSYVKGIEFAQNRWFDRYYPYKTFAFDVHEIDPKGQESPRYVEDGCLNGLAMFVGKNHSLALSAAEFPELRPDSIYFTDEEEMIPYYDHHINHGGHDIGMFNYVTRKFSSVYYSSRASCITRITPPPIWFTPTTNQAA